MRTALRGRVRPGPRRPAVRGARTAVAMVAMTLVLGLAGTSIAAADPGDPTPEVTSQGTSDTPVGDPAGPGNLLVDQSPAPTKAELKAAKKAAKLAAKKAALKIAKVQARTAAKGARAAAKSARTAGKSAMDAGARVAIRSGEASIRAADAAKASAAAVRDLIRDGASAKKIDKAADKARVAAKAASKAARAAAKWPQKIANRLAKCSPQARACVDLTTDMAWLQSGGKVVYGPVPITAGRQGHLTRTGNWNVYYKNKDHKSREFDGAPMPYAVFFDHVGIAFHVGSLSVASHGCIHLSWAAGVKFFDYLGYGALVQVFGKTPYAPGQVYV